MNYQKQHFTLLELLIAVLILAVVSSVIVGVFQETLKHYTKGMIYAEISESLAGGFMVIESDLNRMLPLGDKETIFFKENSFSFIAINKTEQNKSYLELIRYEIDNNTLNRAVVNYPADKKEINRRNISFLDGVEKMNFSYIFPETDDDKKKKSEKDTTETDNKSKDSASHEEKSSKETDEKDKSQEVKRPIIVKMNGIVKNKKIEEYFSTSFFVTHMKAVKGTGTDTDIKDSDSKDKDKSGKNAKKIKNL